MLQCKCCSSQYLANGEGYILLLVHQIVRHGHDINERNVNTSGTFIKTDL